MSELHPHECPVERVYRKSFAPREGPSTSPDIANGQRGWIAAAGGRIGRNPFLLID
jgi:hypothetical protein